MTTAFFVTFEGYDLTLYVPFALHRGIYSCEVRCEAIDVFRYFLWGLFSRSLFEFSRSYGNRHRYNRC